MELMWFQEAGVAEAKLGGPSGYRAYGLAALHLLPASHDFERQKRRGTSGTQEGVPGGEGSCVIWMGALN